MSTLKVNTIRHTGASSDAVTLATNGTCTAKVTNNLSNRNLIVNGSMQCAQRGSSSTADGYQTVDRFKIDASGNDAVLTQAQHDLTSTDTGPWEKGFRKSLHITNGNQSGGAGASDFIQVRYIIEAQDLACSGWNYTSASSYVTLSFWIKSSVAQAFSGSIWTADGTAKAYKFSTPNLSADTWTKVTKTIPGNANLSFDNNNDVGAQLFLYPFIGTGLTSSTANTESWIDTGVYADTVASDWWVQNGATWEITGLQLEVGDVATDFEHRRYADVLQSCKRYYQQMVHASGNEYRLMNAGAYGGAGQCYGVTHFPVEMRTAPSITGGISGNSYWKHKRSYNDSSATDEFDTIAVKKTSTIMAELKGSGNFDAGQNGAWGTVYSNNASASLGFNAEFS